VGDDMEWIYQQIIKIAAVSITAMLLKFALPDGKLKSSAEKVIDMAVLLTIAEPIVSLFYF